ncbi:acyl-CoA synthetase [Aquabacterium sp.]|uniref:LpxL/LpxP family acyltransferase n=1 Tax=Aquabacterium sp. TaxID=1872578 RepID=UPI00378480D2
MTIEPIHASADEARNAPGWTAERERSNAATLRVMCWIALRCGRRVARWVLYPIALYFVLFSPRARRNSRRYLDRALGRPAGWSDGFRHVFSFASTILDRVYFLRHEDQAIEVEVQGHAHVEACLDEGRGAFLIGAHVGSFEALRVSGRHRENVELTMVMYPDNARLINAALAAIAPDAKPQIIALGRPESMLQIRDKLAAGGLVGMLGDRWVPGESVRTRPVPLPFLGRDALFSDGPFRLAALLRQKMIFMVGLYCGGARYQVRFVPLADFSVRDADAAAREQRIQAAMAAYAALLESLCREMPYNWFNFHDFWQEDAD